MPELRFGLLVVPDAPFPTLAERWRRVEELGFDFLFVADHYRHTRNASLPWFDGWTALAAMALQTTTVRIGPLVANPILRGPAVLAKAAAALDPLSDGRLELAIGKGVEEFDHRATGTPFWSPRERARPAFASTSTSSTACSAAGRRRSASTAATTGHRRPRSRRPRYSSPDLR
jgi:alkanesulfonate monooxygenase SsuD/methylene tetrahydromethanopterin reductase-like flavin-dependent oxidoreductase (luciferase family)